MSLSSVYEWIKYMHKENKMLLTDFNERINVQNHYALFGWVEGEWWGGREIMWCVWCGENREKKYFIKMVGTISLFLTFVLVSLSLSLSSINSI